MTDNQDIVRLAFERSAAGDIDGYIELMDPEVVARPLTSPSAYRGHAGIRQFFAETGSGGVAVDDLRVYGVEDAVVATGKLFAPSSVGGLLELPAAWLFRLRGGKVIETWSFNHPAQAFRAAGMEEPKSLDAYPTSMTTTSGPPGEDVVDLEAVGALRDELAGTEVFAELVATFLEGTPTHLSLLHGAVERGQASTAAEEAHAIKGSAATMGAAAVARLAAEIEELGRAGDLAGAKPRLAALEQALEHTGPLLLAEVRPAA